MPRLLRLLHLSAPAAAFVILFMTAVAPAGAEGILYAVPNEPPPSKESVDFTNHLNHRVHHLPQSLNPPTAETPAQVEARIRTLERGVILQPARTKGRGRGNQGEPTGHPGSVATEADGASVGHGSHATAAVTDAPAPLTVAFVGAGVLAALGLLFSARGMRRQRVRTG
jgi:hypothetical protein